YRAEVNSAGFSTVDLRNIDVSGGSTTRVDAQLRVDATRQTIEVLAEAPLIDSSASNVSTTVDTAIIQDVPLQGRDLQQLTFLIPGVNNVGGPPGKIGRASCRERRSVIGDGLPVNTKNWYKT